MKIQLKCPKCTKLISEQPSHIISWYDPNFTCKKCKFHGKMFYMNPRYKK